MVKIGNTGSGGSGPLENYETPLYHARDDRNNGNQVVIREFTPPLEHKIL